jgi:hypothetical protein
LLVIKLDRLDATEAGATELLDPSFRGDVRLVRAIIFPPEPPARKDSLDDSGEFALNMKC